MTSNSLTFSPYRKDIHRLKIDPVYFYIYLVGTMQHMKQKVTFH